MKASKDMDEYRQRVLQSPDKDDTEEESDSVHKGFASGEGTASIKSGGSTVDLSNTLRGANFSAATIKTTKEHFFQLFWQNKHTTVTLCFVFWSFGMCVAFLGPTLLDLGCKTGTLFATMSWVFFSQSFFILLGSACGGLMLKRFSADIILLVGTAMMTITMAAIPMCNALWGLAIVLAVMGFFMGTIDTVANVSMICLYGKDVSPFLQAIHFFYGAGAFLSPMIAQPFLLNEDCSPFISNDTQSIMEFVDDSNHTGEAQTLEEAQHMTRIDYAFWIMALFMVPVVVLAASLVGRRYLIRVIRGTDTTNDDKQKEYENMEGELVHAEDGRNETSLSTLNITVVTILSALLMFLYDGLQAAYGGYIYSYAVKGPARLHKSDAAYLNALFWGMFATGRLLSIALATKLSPSFMLFCNIIGCTTGLLLMLALRYSHVMLIVGTCMLGIFMSSVFPTALSLTEQYIHVTPTTTSFLVFGAAVGEMSMPVIVGHEFYKNGPITFLVTGMVLCFLSVIAYMSLWLAGLTLIKPDSTPEFIVWFNKCMPGSAKQPESENTSLVNQNVQYYSRMHSSISDGSQEEVTGTISFVKRDTSQCE